MGALLPYRRARSLLEEFFPIGGAPEVETIRQRTLHVGARLESEAVAPPTSAPPTEVQPIALTIDGGHVKAVRSYQARSFDVFVAQVSNDDNMQVVFSSVPVEADRQVQQLRGVLHGLRATSRTPVTTVSDGADGPRALGAAASVGPTEHVLTGFISPCAFSTSLRPPRAGWTPRRPGVRKVPVSPTPSNMSIGVSGMARCGGLSISSAKPC